MGILRQLKEEMEGDLSEAQKRERMRAASFAELRAAKMQEIAHGEKMAEEKEDQLANQDNLLAERKEARPTEMKAISETIEILQGDDARDAMSGTFSFVQVSQRKSKSQHRHQAAEALRRAARVSQDPQLSMLATAVE